METAALIKAGSSAAALNLFKSAGERIEKVLKGPAKSLAIKALANLQSYGPYLEDTNERVSTFKTFANPTQPVSLLDHFVTTEFERKSAKKSINQDDILQRIMRPSRIVISATAGFGKSMVMRYLALSLFENPKGKIPIFLELRHLNRVTTPDILAFIHSTYRRVSDVQIEALKNGLSSGTFVLLLDGFDELNHEIRPIIESQILEIARLFPTCSIVLSGRPDDRFEAWRAFTVFKISPMKKLQVVELLGKLEYDAGTKKRFFAKINKGLYETHESFLSTPLLAILMLLTFEQNANIPDKMHLFYSKAFETLFHKHDALKEQYDRSRKSGLQIDEFEKVFSIFCLKTYVLEKTEFTQSELMSSIREALSYEGYEVSAEDFLFDIEEAVCLVMREGTSYFFVHRSFQEYFSAVFLSNCPMDTRDEFIDHVAYRYWDNVLPMLFDMASAQIEPTWTLNNIERYLNEVGPNKIISVTKARFLGFRLHFHSGRVFLADFIPGPFAKFLAVMRRFYPTDFAGASGVSLEKLEQYATENWVNINCESEKDITLNNEEVLTIKNVFLDKMPKSIVDEIGLNELCKRDFRSVLSVREKIDIDQKSKSDFLNKLFKKSP